MKKWSKEVTEHSDAMDLEDGVFEQKDPKKVAESLKRSAEQSDRKKGSSLQSSMSMLNFYINRGAKIFRLLKRKCLKTPKTNFTNCLRNRVLAVQPTSITLT